MGSGHESTAPYRTVIADLRADREKQAFEIEQARTALRTREAALDEIDKAIALLELRIGDFTEPTKVSATMADVGLVGLGLGDACVAAIRELGGAASNSQIVAHLKSRGYEIKSTNPMNNVGTGLNHRSKSRGDVERNGRFWVLKSEGPALNGASH